MRRKGIVSAALAVLLTMAGVFALASPAAASTQTVRFTAGSWRCTNGLYGVSHVDVSASTTAAPYIAGSWSGADNTQVAYVSVTGVPGGGGQAYVVVTYHCKVWTIFGWRAGPGEPANGTRWIYGSPPQPLNTL